MDSIFCPSLSLDQLLIWVDDLLAHCPDASSLLFVLEQIFSLCREYGLKLNAARCTFYSTSVRWCGMIYSQSGVSHDPDRVLALSNFSTPNNAGDLMQFLCACQWFAPHIPLFAQKVSPLRSLLETLLQGSTDRSKKYAKRIPLPRSLWTDEIQSAFLSIVEALKQSVELAHPNPDLETCIFTDSSGGFCSIIVTQVSSSDLLKPITEQLHQPLAFYSRAFQGAMSRWSIPEKEAFPIIDAISRFDYLLIGEKPFHIFTDHRNLVFIFDPSASSIPLKQHTIDKLHRWSLKLSSLYFTIEHIPGERNVWADLLTRWAAPPISFSLHARRVSSIPSGQISPMDSPDFQFPSLETIVISQEQYYQETETIELDSRKFTKENGVLCNGEIILIPEQDSALILRLCIIAHCGTAGHRGIRAIYLLCLLASIGKAFARTSLPLLNSVCIVFRLVVVSQFLAHLVLMSKPKNLMK